MMTNILGVEAAFISISTTITSNGELPSTFLKMPSISSFPLILPPKFSRSRISVIRTLNSSTARSSGATEQQNEVETEAKVAEGYTITQFCDKIIDLFLYEKPKSQEWRKYLVLRQDWKKYSDYFYNRCRARADAEINSESKQQFIALARKVKRIDDEMERHHVLLQEIEDSPTNIEAIVARRRKDFTGDFFGHLMLIQETNSDLEDRDAVARLGARCLSAISAYDKTLETLITAPHKKLNDIMRTGSSQKMRALAEDPDFFMVLTIETAWAIGKEYPGRDELKNSLFKLYKVTQRKKTTPKEIVLLEYLLKITDAEEMLSALATAFSPGDDQQAREASFITTPNELHMWIKIMFDAFNIYLEEIITRKLKVPITLDMAQKLLILKETIEEEYLDQSSKAPKDPNYEE